MYSTRLFLYCAVVAPHSFHEGPGPIDNECGEDMTYLQVVGVLPHVQTQYWVLPRLPRAMHMACKDMLKR
jgi:hypothetical protein